MAIAFDDPLTRRMLVQMLIWTAVLAAMLFLAAGTFAWPQAWIFLFGSTLLGLATGLTIARRNPDLLRERMRGPMQQGQKPWDKTLMAPSSRCASSCPSSRG